MSGQPKLPIFPETPPKFLWRTINVQVTFAIENGRPATSATIYQGGGEVVATRLDETATRAIEAKLPNRIREQIPLPGSEAAVEKFLRERWQGLWNVRNCRQLGDRLALTGNDDFLACFSAIDEVR